MSVHLYAVPHKEATIDPAEVIGAKDRTDMHAVTVDSSFASWQRLTSRTVQHGPVPPRVPESIPRTLLADVGLSESIAVSNVTRWDKRDGSVHI